MPGKLGDIFFRARQQFHQLKESSQKAAFLNQWTRLIFENQHQACLKTKQYCAQFLAGNMIDIEIRRRKTKSGRWHFSVGVITITYLDQKILHWKVRKFTTKKASRQNSFNLRHKLPTPTQNSVNYKLHTQFVKLHTVRKITHSVSKITHCVYNYTQCVKLHAICNVCTNTHCVWVNTWCTKLHSGPFRVQYEKIP